MTAKSRRLRSIVSRRRVFLAISRRSLRRWTCIQPGASRPGVVYLLLTLDEGALVLPLGVVAGCDTRDRPKLQMRARHTLASPPFADGPPDPPAAPLGAPRRRPQNWGCLGR